MSESTLLVEHRPAISWIVFNRPERLNAMNDRLLEEFSAALDRLVHEGASVIGIRGAGRAFCSGFDIGSDSDEVGKAHERSSTDERARLVANIDLFMKIWDHPKPVIAAVHGYCLAGATQLCVFADLTILADDAKVGLPAIPIGGGYITPLWTHLVGPKRAKQMSFVAGSKIDADTAVDWGWANYSVPADTLVSHVEELASEISKIPAEILRIKKTSINRAVELGGFRSLAPLGADLDALLHEAPTVQSMKRAILSDGLKGAIERFKQGEWGSTTGEHAL